MERKPLGMCKVNDCHRTAQTKSLMAGYCCALCTIKNGHDHSEACDKNLEVELSAFPSHVVLGYN